VYFISDWAILNDTKSKQLQRILAEFHHLSESEIRLACLLLESYHAVYRRDRLEQRRNLLNSGQARIQRRCLPPTATQLHEIARLLNAKATLRLETEEVLNQLQNLAKGLQQYRILCQERLKKRSLVEWTAKYSTCDRSALLPWGNRIHQSDFINI
jgi:hypothetical protein